MVPWVRSTRLVGELLKIHDHLQAKVEHPRPPPIESFNHACLHELLVERTLKSLVVSKLTGVSLQQGHAKAQQGPQVQAQNLLMIRLKLLQVLDLELVASEVTL